MFKIGDKVKLVRHPKRTTGVVTKIDTTDDWVIGAPIDHMYTVTFDNTELIPPVLGGYTDTDLELVVQKVCECGVDKIGGGVHDYYCPKGE